MDTLENPEKFVKPTNTARNITFATRLKTRFQSEHIIVKMFILLFYCLVETLFFVVVIHDNIENNFKKSSRQKLRNGQEEGPSQRRKR